MWQSGSSWLQLSDGWIHPPGRPVQRVKRVGQPAYGEQRCHLWSRRYLGGELHVKVTTHHRSTVLHVNLVNAVFDKLLHFLPHLTLGHFCSYYSKNLSSKKWSKAVMESVCGINSIWVNISIFHYGTGTAVCIHNDCMTVITVFCLRWRSPLHNWPHTVTGATLVFICLCYCGI